MEYRCYTWAGVAQPSLSSLDRVQKHLHGLAGDERFSILQLNDEMLQVSCCSITISMESLQAKYIP